MPQRPVSLEPGRDGDPGRAEEDWLAWCESVEGQLGPDDEEEPDDAAPWDADLDAIIAGCREITAEEAAFAVRAAARGLPGGTPVAEGRRGLGQPGSAVRRPGEFASRAAGFGAGMLLDVMPGCGALAGFAAGAAGDDDRYAGACDDEVAGAISAWDRVEAWAAARKHAAVAEFIRRRPRPGSPLESPAQMPEDWDESITAEVAGVLAESRHAADALLGLAHDLELKSAGLEGGMDVLRARACLDLLLGRDSRPGQDGAAASAGSPARGLAARVTLTAPLATLAGLADRPGELAGLGPVDPWLARDLADAAAGSPKTTWCVTVTDGQGHAGPWCRRPAARCDYEHNTPYEAGGRTCLCNAGPKCRCDHRLKQDPRWQVDQLPDGTFRWTTPTGRQYTTEPTRYPV